MTVRTAALLAALLPTVALGARCPNVLLVFDASGSMNDPVSGSNGTRYEVGQAAVASILSGNSQNFRYGLEMFGLSTGADDCVVSSASCSYSSNNQQCASVQCDYATNQSINTVLNLHSAAGLTPTGAAVSTAVQRADMKDATRRRFIVLLTDGLPNDCASNSTASSSLQDALAALNTARTSGIKTYVLGFGEGSLDNLNAMAQAGGTARQATCSANQPCYYNASNAAELNAALQTIIGAVGGELGGGTCDDSCYSSDGCPSGSICKAGSCVANPCAAVTCGADAVCVEGQCRKKCNPACAFDEVCDNGTCLKDAPCAQPCTAKNQLCIGGSCVENYCSGFTYTLPCAGGGAELCVKNACQVVSSGAGGGTGGADGGAGGNPDGGHRGGITTETAGCCSGAPDAFSLFGLLGALAAYASRRRAA